MSQLTAWIGKNPETSIWIVITFLVLLIFGVIGAVITIIFIYYMRDTDNNSKKEKPTAEDLQHFDEPPTDKELQRYVNKNRGL